MHMRMGMVGLAMLGIFAAVASARLEPQAVSPKVRVGTYDSRAIALAYAPSKYNPVGEKMKEHAAAKAAGNTKRVKELEAWGEKHQRALHRQGFGRVPVDDLLAAVKQHLPEVAAKAGVDAIAMSCDYQGANVELVDVTNELVALFEPSERTLGFVRDLKQRQPIDLDDLQKEHKD
jgi:hypothetical protein